MCARPSAPASPAVLLYRETKAETSHAWLPMPDIVAAAVMIRRTQRDGCRRDLARATCRHLTYPGVMALDRSSHSQQEVHGALRRRGNASVDHS
jgi:hypothetical protein